MGEAKFYCESCNNLVEYDAEICPHCGKIFDAVKCPVCKHVGRAESFTKGCPKCGYCAPDMDVFKSGGKPNPSADNKSKTLETPKSSLMPSWVYYSIAGGLLIAFLALVAFYLTM